MGFLSTGLTGKHPTVARFNLTEKYPGSPLAEK
jgi:hypothetical protein